ncbi:hypothetical protein J3F83DRAFT_348353 [Trichoderma novae-zelandiae]
MALRHGGPGATTRSMSLLPKLEATLRLFPRQGRSTVWTPWDLSATTYQVVSQVAPFTGPGPHSKTKRPTASWRDAASGSQAGQSVWATCGEHPRNHEADDGMEQLGQANPPPGQSHSTSKACPRC